ncbi:hypothetical protein SMICM304S_11814 [Streptomyces microflavus]
MVSGKAKERNERRRSANSALAATALNASVVGWAGPVSEWPSGGGASVATESPRDAGAVIWGTVGDIRRPRYRGTVVCLLDNGTEGATKRFTGSFAFSASSRVTGSSSPWPEVTHTHSAAQVHSSNSLAPNR